MCLAIELPSKVSYQHTQCFWCEQIILPVSSAHCEFMASTAITENLKNIIVNQEQNFLNYNKENVNIAIRNTKADKERKYEEEFNEIKGNVDEKLTRSLDLARQKGSGLWLTALPIKSLGYTLNKQHFKDSIC